MEFTVQKRIVYIKTVVLLLVASALAYAIGCAVASGYNVFLEQEIIYPPKKIGPMNYTDKGYGNIVYVYIRGACYDKIVANGTTRFKSLGLCSEWVPYYRLSEHYYSSSLEYPGTEVVVVAVYSTFTADFMITWIAPVVFVILAYGVIVLSNGKLKFIPVLSGAQFISGILGALTGINHVIERMYAYMLIKVHIYILEAIFIPVIVTAIYVILAKIVRK